MENCLRVTQYPVSHCHGLVSVGDVVSQKMDIFRTFSFIEVLQGPFEKQFYLVAI